MYTTNTHGRALGNLWSVFNLCGIFYYVFENKIETRLRNSPYSNTDLNEKLIRYNKSRNTYNVYWFILAPLHVWSCELSKRIVKMWLTSGHRVKGIVSKLNDASYHERIQLISAYSKFPFNFSIFCCEKGVCFQQFTDKLNIKCNYHAFKAVVLTGGIDFFIIHRHNSHSLDIVLCKIDLKWLGWGTLHRLPGSCHLGSLRGPSWDRCYLICT